MSIEISLTQITGVLERIAVALESGAKPTAAAQPAKGKAEPKASKPAPEPAPPVDEAAEPEADETAETADNTVANVVSRLLKAQKRDEAVALLKKFGATSVSGVKKTKEAEFIAEGLEILLAA